MDVDLPVRFARGKLILVRLFCLAPDRLARRTRGFCFARIAYPRAGLFCVVLGGSTVRPPLTKASRAVTGMILLRPTFRLGSSFLLMRLAIVLAESPSLKAASAIPTASLDSS
jgi:hypothetical protein